MKYSSILSFFVASATDSSGCIQYTYYVEDLKTILDINRAVYKRFDLWLPVFDELITGFRWIMTVAPCSHINLAFRVEGGLAPQQYAKIAAELYGKPIDACIELLFQRHDPHLRNLNKRRCVSVIFQK